MPAGQGVDEEVFEGEGDAHEEAAAGMKLEDREEHQVEVDEDGGGGEGLVGSEEAGKGHQNQAERGDEGFHEHIGGPEGGGRRSASLNTDFEPILDGEFIDDEGDEEGNAGPEDDFFAGLRREDVAEEDDDFEDGENGGEELGAEAFTFEGFEVGGRGEDSFCGHD